jgi:hypothetical protein
MNLSTILEARPDSYAKRQGAFVLKGNVARLGSPSEVWNFVRAIGGRQFRVVYRCLDGTVRDMIGRQGVHKSSQDGTVAGIGHSMANAESLNLSFWTASHGTKLNTGAGKGYRTLKASGILALRIDGTDILTDAGLLAMAE